MAKRTPRSKQSVEEMVDEQLDNPKPVKKSGGYEPVYKMITDAAIPISKHEGTVWEARMQSSLKISKTTRDAWQEAIKYYNNDQMNHRVSTNGDYSGNVIAADRLSPQHTETENIVYSNVTTLVAVTYAKNPSANVVTNSKTNKPLAKVLEDLLNVLIQKDNAPGVGLKKKAKRAVALAELTNNAWIKLSWTDKEDSTPEALQQYEEIVKKLAVAKSTKEVEELEQKLVALEEKIAFSAPSGMGLRVIPGFNIITDPTATEDDLTDHQWLLELDYLPTQYINCVYGQKDEESGKVKSTYKPSHYLKLNQKESNDVDALINSFSIYKETETDWESLGFSSLEAFKRAQYTEVAYVWDKIKRRVLMYATNDWSWPIWVWEDPLRLDRFFPYYKLAFYLNPLGGVSKGEVTYYLDQQDAINEINDEQRRARHWIRRNVLFNKNKMKQEDVEAYLKGVDETARGVALNDGETFEEVIWSQPPPGFKFYDMFTQQKGEKIESINRISSMNDVLTGTQFKTNTTNQAIDTYQKGASIRLDDRTDALEDFLGDILWGMAQLALMKYTPEDVMDILDRQDVQGVWMQVTDPKELQKFQVRVMGGSTTKPTSAAKKEEAIKVAQALGQFANAAPMVIMKMLEVLEDAFDNLVMTDEDWEEIKQSIMTQQQNQVGGTPTEGAPQGAGDSPEGGGGLPPELEAQIAELPPEVQKAVLTAIERGVPPEKAIQGVLERLQGT